MNFIDIIVIGAVIVFAWSGWRNGFVAGLMSFIGFIGGGLLGAFLAPMMLETFKITGAGALALTVGIVLGLAMTGQILTSILGRRVRDHIDWRPARFLDSLGGAALNILAIAVIGWILAATASVVPASSVATQVRASRVLSTLDMVVPAPARDLVSNLQALIDDSGLPKLFDSFGVLPNLPVDPPSTATVKNPAVQDALGSVVKVQGVAEGCGTGSSGSGFVVSSHRVLTNAHVVAAVDNPRVTVPNVGELSATTVYFDPKIDVAILEVPDLEAPVLKMSGPVERGTNTVIAGYPGGGPMTATAARVRGTVSGDIARGSDIYGRSGVSREIYSLRGTARPGNSGGPLLTGKGTVAGVVFAQAQSDPETAFALTAAQVENAINVGSVATQEVSTGPCKR